MVSHDMDPVARYADRVVVIESGHLRETSAASPFSFGRRE